LEHFSRIIKWVSNKAAQPFVGFPVLLIILVWVIVGLPFHFSAAWHLIIGRLAAAFYVTMLFIIQNSQNRHTVTIQLKLDEIIRATKGAHNEMMDIEKLTDEDLARIQKKYGLLVEKTKIELKQGKPDTDTPDIGKVITEK